MTDHKVALKELQDAIADASEAADHAGAKLAAMREILIRPEGPAALVAYHGNATRATEHLDFLDGELATVETNTKETRKQISGVEGGADDLRKMIKELYRGVRADSNGPMFANVGTGPLTQSVRDAAAEAGHPVPAPPKKPVVPWQKLRVWRDGAWNPTSPGAIELMGGERLDAINDALLDGAATEGVLLVPPWLVTKDGDVALSTTGHPVGRFLALLVDEAIHAFEDVDIDDTGLGAAMGGEDSEHTGWPPAPEGRILEQRRARGERLTVEDLAHLDGIPAAWLTRTEAHDGWTYYTLDRHLPPVPQAPADPVREAEGRAFDAAVAAAQAPTSDDPDLAVPCPLSGCEQPPGSGCVNYKGKGCATHADRRKAAEKARGGEKGAKPKKQKKGAA